MVISKINYWKYFLFKNIFLIFLKTVAEKYYPEIAYFNDYGWVYILGGVLILFLVVGCCVCLCKIGSKDAHPATNGGYQPVPQPAVPQPVAQQNVMYDALPERMPSFMQKGKKPKKQPSMVRLRSV